MSYRVRRSRLEPGPRFRLGEEFYKKIVEGQPNDILLFLQEEHFKGLLSGFNRSSLRKVHSVVTETLQEVLRGFSQVTERPELKRNLELLATRTKIILQYQSNRGLANHEVVYAINKCFDELINALRKTDCEKSRKLANQMLLAMDALVAFWRG